jgi:thioredoxin reductase (NADPH)
MATNFRGIYAAGDCTGRPYQFAKAVGEGNVAAHGVIEYLASLGGEPDNA